MTLTRRAVLIIFACLVSGIGVIPEILARQAAPATAQADSAGLKSITRVVRVGAWVETGIKGVSNVQLALPVPTDWPEQHVVMFEEHIPDEVRRSDYRDIDTINRLVALVPKIPPATNLELEVLFEVTTRAVPYPERTDHLVKPKRPPSKIRIYLSPSDKIESRKSPVRKQAAAIVAEHEQPWEQARAIYDWVTTNIEISEKMKETGALAAIENLRGSREDPSYAFVALCRSQKIPARMVWADNGEYAEFYLQDDTGEGRWYPVVLEGNPEFGQMSDPRIIFQKGDNIKIPESKKRLLYVTETIQGNGKIKSVRWLRDVLPARNAK